MARKQLAQTSLGARTFRLEQESEDGTLWLIEFGGAGRSANRLSDAGPIGIFTHDRWLLAGRTPDGTARIECTLTASGPERPRVIEGTKGWIAVMPEGRKVDVTIRFQASDGRHVASHELALDWQDPPWDAHPLRYRIHRWLRRPKKGVTHYGP